MNLRPASTIQQIQTSQGYRKLCVKKKKEGKKKERLEGGPEREGSQEWWRTQNSKGGGMRIWSSSHPWLHDEGETNMVYTSPWLKNRKK